MQTAHLAWAPHRGHLCRGVVVVAAGRLV